MAQFFCGGVVHSVSDSLHPIPRSKINEATAGRKHLRTTSRLGTRVWPACKDFVWCKKLYPTPPCREKWLICPITEADGQRGHAPSRAGSPAAQSSPLPEINQLPCVWCKKRRGRRCGKDRFLQTIVSRAGVRLDICILEVQNSCKEILHTSLVAMPEMLVERIKECRIH